MRIVNFDTKCENDNVVNFDTRCENNNVVNFDTRCVPFREAFEDLEETSASHISKLYEFVSLKVVIFAKMYMLFEDLEETSASQRRRLVSGAENKNGFL